MLVQDWAPAARVKTLAVPIMTVVMPAVTGLTVAQRCTEGVPADAKVERFGVIQDMVVVVLSHPDWPIVAMNQTIPQLQPQIEPLHIVELPPSPGERLSLAQQAQAQQAKAAARRGTGRRGRNEKPKGLRIVPPVGAAKDA